jgi:predicted RNA-binding Zn ribbon-like protein
MTQKAHLPSPKAFPKPLADSPVTRIAREVHHRFWHLPSEIARRSSEQAAAKQSAYNEYLRTYMREVYRPDRKQVTLTFTKQQHRSLQRAAEQSGRKLAPFIRETALASLENRFLVPKDLEQRLFGFTIQLRKIGTNINQLAHHANQKRHTVTEDLTEIRRVLTRMEAEVIEYVTHPPLSDPPST